MVENCLCDSEEMLVTLQQVGGTQEGYLLAHHIPQVCRQYFFKNCSCAAISTFATLQNERRHTYLFIFNRLSFLWEEQQSCWVQITISGHHENSRGFTCYINPSMNIHGGCFFPAGMRLAHPFRPVRDLCFRKILILHRDFCYIYAVIFTYIKLHLVLCFFYFCLLL